VSAQVDLERVMALAGIHQATFLVQQIARYGRIDADPFNSSIASVFTLEAQSTEDVYGGWTRVATGLRTLAKQLGRRERDVEVSRYTVSLLFLERKLTRREDLMEVIRDGIDAAGEQVEYFSLTHSNVLARLADIYSNTVSTLSPRIMVTGTPAHLNNPDNANKVRALLLAGMRSTVLWRQLGGSRLQLVFGRKHILAAVESCLEELEA